MAAPEHDESFVDRLSRQGEEALGKIAEELIANPVVNAAIARAFEAREKAVQAQEAAMGALNLPSAADIERVTRRLRSLSQRLEGIEDAHGPVEERARRRRRRGAGLTAIEGRLDEIARDVASLRAVDRPGPAAGAARAGAPDRQRDPERRVARARPRAGPIASSSSGSARRDPSGAGTSVTPSTAAASTPRSSASRSSVAVSISTAAAPGAASPRRRPRPS